MALLREVSAQLERVTVNIYTAIVIVGVVAIVGYYLTAAFIVARTGDTAGIGDLGKGAARILRAVFSSGADEE